MAEGFGIATGALSVAALFNNCVITFEYIQLGCHFGEDYERCQLKLDIAKTRLSRWGKAIDIHNDPRFTIHKPQDKSSRQAQAIMEEIDLLFKTLQKASERYAIDALPEDLRLLQIEDMQPVAQKLHNRLGEIVKHRRKKTSILKKAAWALYDGKNFDKLVGEVTGFVDSLEKLYPVEAARRDLVRMEIEELDEDEPSLRALQSAAVDTDLVLSEAAAKQLETYGGMNYAKHIHNDEEARVKVGDEWSDRALSRSARPLSTTRNGAGSVVGKGSSRTHIGNSYGGPGIFDR
ncbi:prion-inhibition and propagation-domain-containing protein [Xylaria castorea]|nr:prion-inhibition and propagation-domain-containing protein [Xylaria castorea]